MSKEKPQRMTGGVLNFILANKRTFVDDSTDNKVLDEDTLDTLCENIFQWKGPEDSPEEQRRRD